MYRSFRARNFRCFTDLHVEDIARVNLIAGLNNVGKTALLEALFVHAGAQRPILAVVVNTIRGLNVGKAEVPGDSNLPWDSLFAGYARSNRPQLSGRDEDGEEWTVRLRVIEDPSELGGVYHLMPPKIGETGAAQAMPSALAALALEYEAQGAKARTSYLLFGDKGYSQVPIPPAPRFQCLYFGAQGRYDPTEDADRLGKMELSGQQDVVRDALRVIEPRLQRLAVVSVAGSPLVHGDIGLGRLVPLAVMGAGMGRLLSVVVGISHAANGVVLIDEIENGLHYTVHQKVWRAIAEAARQFDVQVFATTHSIECIEAATRAFGADLGFEDDFRLHRLERVNGTIVAKTGNREAVRSALDIGLEVR